MSLYLTRFSYNAETWTRLIGALANSVAPPATGAPLTVRLRHSPYCQ